MKIETRDIAVVGTLGALTAVLGATVGFVPVPTPAGAATLMHIPAIIAGIVEGPIIGGLVGFIFGLFSWTRATIPFFKDPLIAFVPRILIGVVAAYTFMAVRSKRLAPLFGVIVGLVCLSGMFYGLSYLTKANKSTLGNPSIISIFKVLIALISLGIAYSIYRAIKARRLATAVAAITGTLTNTVGVLSLIVLRFGKEFPPEAAYMVGVTHGIPEIIMAVIIVVPIVLALNRALKKEVE
ncbi:MAG: ECF transporter S component [Actinomycetota bacterium]|nr:ECF transporter S component [Actinomycetota bacterium]MDI6822400.1 ECF transporter S component [Actinomycetota bacterium]